MTGAGGRKKVTVRMVARGPKAKVAARRVPATRACDGSGRLVGNLKIPITGVEQDDEGRSGDRRSGGTRGGRRQRSRGAPSAETRSGGFPVSVVSADRPGRPRPGTPRNPGQQVVVRLKRVVAAGRPHGRNPSSIPGVDAVCIELEVAAIGSSQWPRPKGTRATAGPRSPRRGKTSRRRPGPGFR